MKKNYLTAILTMIVFAIALCIPSFAGSLTVTVVDSKLVFSEDWKKSGTDGKYELWTNQKTGSQVGWTSMFNMGTLNLTEDTDLFWAKLYNQNQFDDQISMKMSLKICVDNDCVIHDVSRNLSYQNGNMFWNPISNASTVAVGSNLIQLWEITNLPRAWNSTDDFAVGAKLVPKAETPEPMSLMLLGTGLAGVAIKLRRKTK